MPRLNYGTLLENIVVLETTQICLDRSTPDDSLAFASAFAMPPLTQCWCKPADEANNPLFNNAFLVERAAGQNVSQSIQQLWSLCINNMPDLPVWLFHGDHAVQYATAGPNGALLASMLTVQRGGQIHLWINDNGERYPGRRAPVAGTPPDTLAQAALLVGGPATGTACEPIGWFPDTIPHLTEWLDQGAAGNAAVRLGFLDPDNYAEGLTQVSPQDHRQWLHTLATNAERVLSVTFSGCQNRGAENAARNQRLAWFHGDEEVLYPVSMVFEYGNFQTGVKVRWPQDSIHDVVGDLRHRVEAAWTSWSPSLRALTVHLNGQSQD